MFERFAAAARVAVDVAVGEAGRRGDRRVGTDHLLIAILYDPGVADAVGTDPAAARRVADDIDSRALAGIGLDLGGVGSLEPAAGATRLPFTPGSKAALKRTLALVGAGRARRIEPKHLLLALLERDEPDPAANLLAGLHVDKRRARERASLL